ncbi:ABC transporter permease [Spirochaeta cellobiosiphila]|uniref:ABC transporter permease n=1 Tax=Spirochaeta cellobiosiphila TaxID=504483 RepID=UPI00048B767C|nr:FtsX-like permease family protein [Spirochaeta cellobiosiphila]
MSLGLIAIRNITRNPMRSSLSSLSVLISTTVIVFAFSMINGMMDEMKNNNRRFLTGSYSIEQEEYHERINQHPLHLRIENYQDIIDSLKANIDIQSYSPRIPYSGAIYKDNINYSIMGYGVNFALEKDFQQLNSLLIAGSTIPQEDSKDIIIGAGLARKTHLHIGDKITLNSITMFRGINYYTFKIVGIAVFPIPGLNNSLVLTPMASTQQFLKMNNSVNQILLQLPENLETLEIQQYIKELSNSQSSVSLNIRLWKEASESYSFILLAQKIYYIIALLLFILGSSVIINTTMMVILERTKELGTLSAIGMTSRQLLFMVYIESFIISLFGAMAGTVLGCAVTYFTGHFGINLSEAMEGVDFDISSIIYPRVSIYSTIFVFFYSLFIASISTSIPALRVLKIKPVDALNSY